MTKLTNLWADEVPPILSVSNEETENFFIACALHIGNPSKPVDVTHLNKSCEFTAFYRSYFPERRMDAYAFVHYMIWYEKEEARLQTGAKKPDMS